MKFRPMLVVFVAAAMALATGGIAFAAVTTDQADYAPGSVVTISGSNDADGAPGYQAGEAVDVTVTGPGGWTATCTDDAADDAGAWSCPITLKSDDSAIGDYSYTAVGRDSGTTESSTFKDDKPAQPVVTTTGEATVKGSHIGSTNPGFANVGDDCADVYDALDPAPTPPNDWGWHFVFQGGATVFVTLSVTYDPGVHEVPNNPADDVTITDFQFKPTGANEQQHAYVFTPEDYMLISGSATTSGTAPLDTEFNLSHVCPGHFASSLETAIHLGADHVTDVQGTTINSGSTIHDSATVTGNEGGPTPTGSVTFQFFNSKNCTGAASAAGTVGLNGDGVADPSTSKGPLTVGDYSFLAHYSGDSASAPSDGPCEWVTAAAPSSTIQTFVHLDGEHATDQTGKHVPLGSKVHDSALLKWAAANPTDPAPDLPAGSSVTFSFYKTDGCTGDPDSTGDPIPVGGATGGELPLDNQLPKGPLGAGSYGYIASFTSGDDTIVPDANGACEPVTIDKGELTIVTEIHLGDDHDADVQSTDIDLGSTIHDSAIVTGIVDGVAPENDVEFTFHGSTDKGNTNVGTCNAADDTTPAGTVALDNEGIAHPSDSYGPLHAGNYGFTASIAEDDNYTVKGNLTCEPVTVNKGELTIVTEIHLGGVHDEDVQSTDIDLGSTIHDSAIVTGIVDEVGFAPSNKVQFNVYGSNALGNTNVGNCADTPPSDAGLVPLVVNGSTGVAHPSDSFGPLHAGKYGFTASIAEDSDYDVTGNLTCEPVTVKKGELEITTQLHLDGNHTTDIQGTSIPVDSKIHDSATVTGIVDETGFAPTNSVQFNFYGSNTLGNTNIGNCADTPPSDAGLVPLVVSGTTGVAHPSLDRGPLFGGKYGFTASIAGDGDYIGSGDSACEPVTVKPQFGLTMGFWGNNNGQARLLAAGYPLVNIGRGGEINTALESKKVLPNTLNACGKGTTTIFTGQDESHNCTLAGRINVNSLNTLAAQTLALGYNIQLVTGYAGQNIGGLQCTASLTTGLTSASTVEAAFAAAVALINGSALDGTTTQTQIGAMNQLLGCLNREA